MVQTFTAAAKISIIITFILFTCVVDRNSLASSTTISVRLNSTPSHFFVTVLTRAILIQIYQLGPHWTHYTKKLTQPVLCHHSHETESGLQYPAATGSPPCRAKDDCYVHYG